MTSKLVLLSTFLVLLASLLQRLSAQYCPPANAISPCSCSGNSVFCNPQCESEVSCCDFNDATLGDALQKTEAYPFRYAVFCQLRASHFPASSFDYKQFRNLRIQDSTLDTLFDAAPPGNTLEQLTLQNVRLNNGLQWNLLTNFDKMTSLVVTRVYLPQIDDSFGSNLSKRLVNLDISQTQTTTLGDNVFAPFSNLIRLSVSDTEIRNVKRSMFPNPCSLVTLTLRRNKIESLPEDFLAGMNSLMRLELDGNQITTLPQPVFGRSPPMSIEVGGNPINCDCQMKWMARRGFLPHIAGVCAAPPNKRGNMLYSLGPYDFYGC